MFGAQNTYSSAASGSSSQQRIQVELNERGQVVGDNAGKLKTKLGRLVRTHIPITYTNWKYVPKNYKEDIWTDIRPCLWQPPWVNQKVWVDVLSAMLPQQCIRNWFHQVSLIDEAVQMRMSAIMPAYC